MHFLFFIIGLSRQAECKNQISLNYAETRKGL